MIIGEKEILLHPILKQRINVACTEQKQDYCSTKTLILYCAMECSVFHMSIFAQNLNNELLLWSHRGV